MVGNFQKRDALVQELKMIDQSVYDNPDYRRDENIHRIFLYPAMMVPITQKILIEIIAKYLPSNAYAIDPYMGSATSILSCMEVGLNAFGQDINPLAVLISKVKTGPWDCKHFEKRMAVLKKQIEKDTSRDICINFPNIDKWFKKDVQISLSKIKRAIETEPSLEVRRLFWVVMAEVIRNCSNDRTSTYKLHQRRLEEIIKREIDIINEYFKLLERSIIDIQKYKSKLTKLKLTNQSNYSKQVDVRWGNTLEKINSQHKFTLLVSSPPYGDNHTTVTYGQHSYLELQWINSLDIDENINYDFLRTTQEIDRLSLGGKIDQKQLQQISFDLDKKSPTLKAFINSFLKEEKNKIHKILSFIHDFDKSLDNIISSMENDAFYLWTIGNRNVAKKLVPNDKILQDLMEFRGFQLIYKAERTIQNKKQPKRNKTSNTMDKEQILLFQKQEI